MAYDFCVGDSRFVTDNPKIVGAIELNEYPELCSLANRKDCFFLNRMTDLFQDQSFSLQELIQAQVQLLDLLPIELTHKERVFFISLFQ